MRVNPDLWHPDGVYVNSRDDPDHGPRRGIDEVQELVRSWVDSYPDLRVEPVEILVNDERVFVWTRFTGHGAGSGIPMDMELAHVCTVENGRMRRIEEYFDRTEGLEVAGLREQAGES